MIVALYSVSKTGKKTVMIYAGYRTYTTYHIGVGMGMDKPPKNEPQSPELETELLRLRAQRLMGRNISMWPLAAAMMTNMITQMGRNPSFLW